jgi:hypothetical protein
VVTLYQSASVAGVLQMLPVSVVATPIAPVMSRAPAGPSSGSAASSPVHCAGPATHAPTSQIGFVDVVHSNDVVHSGSATVSVYAVAAAVLIGSYSFTAM